MPTVFQITKYYVSGSAPDAGATGEGENKQNK